MTVPEPLVCSFENHKPFWYEVKRSYGITNTLCPICHSQEAAPPRLQKPPCVHEEAMTIGHAVYCFGCLEWLGTIPSLPDDT